MRIEEDWPEAEMEKCELVASGILIFWTGHFLRTKNPGDIIPRHNSFKNFEVWELKDGITLFGNTSRRSLQS